MLALAKSVRWAVVLPGVNVAAWLLFFVVRSPNTLWLAELEQARQRGQWLFNSSAPWTTLAERPLNNWSSWHGGEALPVKLMEIPNVAPLVAAGVAVIPFSRALTATQASWLRGAVFLLLASMQWVLVGRRLDRRFSIAKAQGAA
jgi:hypothetical protein